MGTVESHETEGIGVFCCGDGPADSASAKWHLSHGTKLSEEEPWRAEIVLKDFEPGAVRILTALEQETICRLKTADGAVFRCRVFDIEYIADSDRSPYFEVCSLDQQGAKLCRSSETKL